MTHNHAQYEERLTFVRELLDEKFDGIVKPPSKCRAVLD
jgi:hypothetical protein